MPVDSAKFALKPNGFFDANPALNVPAPDDAAHCSVHAEHEHEHAGHGEHSNAGDAEHAGRVEHAQVGHAEHAHDHHTNPGHGAPA